MFVQLATRTYDNALPIQRFEFQTDAALWAHLKFNLERSTDPNHNTDQLRIFYDHLTDLSDTV